MAKASSRRPSTDLSPVQIENRMAKVFSDGLKIQFSEDESGRLIILTNLTQVGGNYFRPTGERVAWL